MLMLLETVKAKENVRLKHMYQSWPSEIKMKKLSEERLLCFSTVF